MANISDIIMQQVQAAAVNLEIPSQVKSQVLGGLGDSILGSLTQTASKAGGIDAIKDLFTGKTQAAASPVTALAGKLFTNNILSKLNLGQGLSSSLSGLIPTILGKTSSFIKDQDGDGDVDLNDILLTLKGGSGSILGSVLGSALGGGQKKSSGGLGGILGGALGSILGGKK